jgi:hypothetical protein
MPLLSGNLQAAMDLKTMAQATSRHYWCDRRYSEAEPLELTARTKALARNAKGATGALAKDIAALQEKKTDAWLEILANEPTPGEERRNASIFFIRGLLDPDSAGDLYFEHLKRQVKPAIKVMNASKIGYDAQAQLWQLGTNKVRPLCQAIAGQKSLHGALQVQAAIHSGSLWLKMKNDANCTLKDTMVIFTLAQGNATVELQYYIHEWKVGEVIFPEPYAYFPFESGTKEILAPSSKLSYTLLSDAGTQAEQIVKYGKDTELISAFSLPWFRKVKYADDKNTEELIFNEAITNQFVKGHQVHQITVTHSTKTAVRHYQTQQWFVAPRNPTLNLQMRELVRQNANNNNAIPVGQQFSLIWKRGNYLLVHPFGGETVFHPVFDK